MVLISAYLSLAALMLFGELRVANGVGVLGGRRLMFLKVLENEIPKLVRKFPLFE